MDVKDYLKVCVPQFWSGFLDATRVPLVLRCCERTGDVDVSTWKSAQTLW